MSDKDLTWGVVPVVLWNVLAYNFIEFSLLIALIIDGWNGDPFVSWVLWVSSAIMATWVITTTVGEAENELKRQVLSRQVFIFDFAGAAIIVFGIAVVLWSEPWYFKTIFLLGTVQNLRLLYYTVKWLAEERHERDTNTPS